MKYGSRVALPGALQYNCEFWDWYNYQQTKIVLHATVSSWKVEPCCTRTPVLFPQQLLPRTAIKSFLLPTTRLTLSSTVPSTLSFMLYGSAWLYGRSVGVHPYSSLTTTTPCSNQETVWVHLSPPVRSRALFIRLLGSSCRTNFRRCPLFRSPREV